MKHPTITIGKASEGAAVELDVLRLVDTRLLIQANSGGGKSWLFRRIAEQTAGQVQTIILDPEGEFVTLREKHDFLIAGPGGEVPADPRSAGLLCRRLVELQTSAVVDLFELKLPERREFVKRFLETLLDLPKTLWHPVLVMIDEAHLFAPERSAGESVATEAVIGLMSQGRKRGFCGMLATQRLSKLHKDAEAETNNVFIGRTWLDIDQKRAGQLLGKPSTEYHELRDLEAGDFYCFGPALSCKGVAQVRVGPVQTTHPKPGERHKLAPPRPSDAVKRIAAELKDLPQQADEEAKNLAEAKKQIAELKRQLKTSTKPVDEKEMLRKVELATRSAGQMADQRIATERKSWVDEKRDLERKLVQAGKTMRQIAGLAGGLEIDLRNKCTVSPETVAPKQVAREPVKKSADYAPKYTPPPEPVGDGELTAGMRKILNVVAMLGIRGLTPDRDRIARWLSLHPNGGRYGRDLAALRKAGLLDDCNLTPEGEAMAVAGGTGEEKAVEAIPDESTRNVLREIIAAGETLTRDSLAERLGLHPNGGRYGRSLAWLRTMGLIPEKGDIKPTPAVFA